MKNSLINISYLTRAALLLCIFLCISTDAWGVYVGEKYTCTGYSYSKPSGTGYTWITLNGTSFDGSFSNKKDDHDNSGYSEKESGWGSAPSTWDVTATMYAKPKDDYKFIGWYNNADGTGAALSTSTNDNCKYETTVQAVHGSGNPARNFYAIFAKFKASTTTVEFGNVILNSGSQNKTVTIACHNVGNSWTKSDLSGMLSASLSNNKTDNSQHTCTLTVTLNPTTLGAVNQTLSITTPRGGTINITITATVVENYYTKAVAHAVPSSVGKVWAGVGLYSTGDGTHSRGWVNPGTADTYDWTYVQATSAPTYSYHFYKQDPNGYTFNGWYKNSACDDLKTTNADFLENVTATTTEKTDLEYWAHWTANQYTITFNKQGGANGTNSATVHFDNNDFSVKPIISPTRDGYIFGGYYTAVNGGGVQIVNASGVWQSNKSGYLNADGKWIKAENTTVYAKWTPITYTVVFNGNGSTSGSMANQNFTYDVAQNLTSNAFARTGYKFNGWNRAANGSSTGYTNGQNVSNLTTTHNGTVNLFAQWAEVTVNSIASNGAPTTAPLTFTKPEAKTATVVFNVSNADGISHFTNSISGAGWTITNCTYASNQVTITVQYTCSATTTQGQHTATVTLTSKAAGASSQTATVAANVNLTPSVTANKTAINFGTYNLVTSSRMSDAVTLTFNENATVYGKTADGDIAPFTTSWSADHKTLTVYFEPAVEGSWAKDLVVTVKNSQTPQLSDTKTIHITGSAVRHNATVTCNIANSYMVDDAAINLNTLWTSTSNGAKTYSVHSFTPSGSNNEDATAPAVINNSTLSLGQAGTLVVKMVQPQTTTYNAVEETKTIIINKYANALTCDWGTWSKNLATDDGAYVNFASANASTPITVTQTPGDEALATYYPDQHAIYTSFSLGSATWTVAQAENYKYVAPTPQTLTVNIITVTEGCYAYGPAYPDATASSVGEILLPKAGSGHVLSFRMKRNQLAGDQATLTAFDANNTQLAQWKPSAGAWTSYDDGHTIELPAGTKKIYFQRGGTLMDSDNPYINDIRITRTEWITLQDVNGTTISSLEKLTNTIGGNSATATFYVDYSVCAGEVRVGSSNPHITVSPSSFTPTAERQEITVTYSSNVPEVINDAEITVYTASQNATLTLDVETEKQTPYLIWGSLYQSDPVSLPVTFVDNAAATASNDAVVTYSVRAGEESIISVALDGRSFTIVGEGTAHLTATSAANTMWKSVSETKVINTTNKKIQNIVWNQNFTRSLQLGNEREMTAEVHVLDLAAGTEEYSAERTALITYSCPVNSVIEMIDATHFRVIGYGEVTLTASVEGDEDYAAAASITKLVKVREQQTGECDPALMMEVTDEIEFYAFSLGFPEVVHDLVLDHSKGQPDKLNFYVRGVSYDVAIQYYSGGIDVYESTDGGSTWSEKLATVAPEKNTTAYSSTIQLSPNANKLRFVRPQGGQGYHYVGGLTISTIPAISVAHESMDLGNIGCGATYNGHITLSYYNAKGDLTVSKTNSTNGLTIDESVEADCGTTKTINVPFSVFPTVEGPWSNTVTFTDELNNVSVEVELTANVTKASQSIVWNPETTITPAEAPVLDAYATSGLPVTYAVTSGGEIASIEDGVVVVSGVGTFTITVSQAGNVSFAAVSQSWTFTVNGRYLFNGNIDNDWTKAGNWEIGEVPTTVNDVIIQAATIIDSEITVNSINITTGSVTIMPTGGLTVGDGGITGATTSNLILKAAQSGENKGQTGYLRISPAYTGAMPQATVELYSKAYYDYDDKTDNIAKWQYVGSPLARTDIMAKTVYTTSWIYSWNESADKWFNERKTLKFTPFVGYATTQRTYPDGILLSYTGQLVSNQGKHDLDLAWSGEDHGYNAIANSFAAPIDITKFSDEDFFHADSVVYLFNTGSRSQAMAAAAQKSPSVNTPGQFLAIPVGSIRMLKKAFDEMPTTIASMQGFFVHALAEDARVTMEYDKLVWNGDYGENPNVPIRAPKQRNDVGDEEVDALQISVFSEMGADHLFMLESERFNSMFENGLDARKLMGDALNIFSVAGNDQLAVDATNSIIGTRVGIRTGEETAYTLAFNNLRTDIELALLDNETEQTIDIENGVEYTFFAEPNTIIADRFMIVERDNADKPGVTTDIEQTAEVSKVHKFIQNGKLFILKNGVLYDAMGKAVR